MKRVSRIRQAGSAVALAAVAAGLVGTPSPALAQAAACVAPPAPQSPGVSKNIDTTLGCDNGQGVASNPATGYISVTMPSGVTSAQLIDVFAYELPFGRETFTGDYTVAFSNCTGGSGTGSSYSVLQGGQVSAQTLPVYTATSAGGTVACRYSVTYSGTPPEGSEQFYNLVQASGSGWPQEGSYAQSPTVNRFDGPAPAVPEAPFAALFVVIGAAAAFLVIRKTRSGRLAPAAS